jgi:hypothetical protein
LAFVGMTGQMSNQFINSLIGIQLIKRIVKDQ